MSILICSERHNKVAILLPCGSDNHCRTGPTGCTFAGGNCFTEWNASGRRSGYNCAYLLGDDQAQTYANWRKLNVYTGED